MLVTIIENKKNLAPVVLLSPMPPKCQPIKALAAHTIKYGAILVPNFEFPFSQTPTTITEIEASIKMLPNKTSISTPLSNTDFHLTS